MRSSGDSGASKSSWLFADFPPEDLATAGRVLSIITTRANAELAGPDLS